MIVCSFCLKKLSAQQFNNWVFPYNNGLTFNTNPPSSFSGTQISAPLPPPYFTTYSTAASISDNNGQLLFYSDGVRVWNRNNVLMPNGFGLQGYLGQINTALIIPFINDTSKYYLFTAQGLADSPQPDTNKYSYSVIDMQLDGGLGDVINKNTFIKNFATEKMVAIPAANGNDIWWIGRDWTNHFYSYKINCSGFQNSAPVVSTVGSNTNSNAGLLFTGDLKASPDGKYITVSYGIYFEIYQFNNLTGVLSNPIKIPAEYCYGVEFSPNSKFLYTTQIFNLSQPSFTSDVVQYSLAVYDSTQISNSLVKVSQMQPGANRIYQGGLQVGPDNKIYLCGLVNPVLSTVNKPDNAGLACDFQDSILILPNPAWRRFPYCYTNLISAQNVQISYVVAPDCRTVTFTGKTYIKGNNLTFKWQWGEPPPIAGTPLDSATQVVPSQGDTTYTTITHTYPLGQDTFFVHLTVTSDTLCGIGRAGKKVIVKPPRPTANFGYAAACGNLTVAFTDSSLLNSNPSITYQYAWKPALAPPAAYTNYSTQPNNSFTFAAYDSFDVRLIVTSALSCVPQDTIVKRVILKAKPVASCSAVNNCGSLQASFTSTATIAAGSITQQEYYVGNTLIGTGASFTYSFAAYGSYTVKQVVKSNFNCISDTFLLSVIIKDKPQINFISPLKDSVCNSSSYTITANATVNASTITNYVWLKDNVLLANNTNSLTETNLTGTYMYKLLATSAQGCPSDTAVKTITVVSKPTVTLGATNNCGSKSIAITASAVVINDAITNHYINYGDGNASFVDPNNTTYTYVNYGTYNLKYVAKSSVGCESDTAYQTIVVKDKPVVNLVTPRDSICNNSSYTITANVTVNATTISSYVWLKNNVVLANNTNTLTETNPTGIYTYKLVATSAEGCPSDTAVKTITVVSKPMATINAINNCGSKSIAITASAVVINDAITNHYINYGDGNTSAINPNNTTYTYANYGTYNIKYVAKSSVGCESDTAYATIVVKDKPVVSLITPRDSVCNNSSYTITANVTVNATTISSYVWLKNNVVLANNTNTLTETNPTGIYTYKHVATSAQGCPSDTAVKTITVVSKPTSGLNAVNNCGSKQISITSTAAVINDNITNHFISYGDGNTSNGNPNNTSYSFASYGTYTIKYVVQSSIGCASDTAYQTIDVKDKPVASISYGNNACTNTNYVLTGNASVNAASISSYRWFKNGVLLPVNSSTLTENNPAGSYTYKLVVSSSQSCISDTAVQVVLVDNRPTANFTANNDCVGKTITIANNSVPNNPTVSYLWTTSDGQTSNAPVPSFVFNSSGTKTILLKVSSPNGSCVDNSSQTITIDAYPIAAFDITEACIGKPLVISNNSTGTIASYAWQTSNAQQSSSMVPTFIFDTAGNYSIKLDVATANNCSATVTKSTPIQPVQLVVRPAIDTNVNVNQPVQLSISGAATYSWLPFNNLSNAASSNPVFRSAVAGIFPLTVNATTAQGCKANATTTIKVFAAGEYLFIPNAFTPNGDGKNDQFNFTCAGLQALSFFRVYNRYGQTVYQQNSCGTTGWDGTFKGTKQPGGAYVYNWQGVAFNGQKVSGNGSVILVR